MTEADLSEYAQSALHVLTKKRLYRAQKLSATFRRRERIAIHGLNLRLFVELGITLVAVHCGISFCQEKFIKPYIDNCCKKRAEARTKTAKELQKILVCQFCMKYFFYYPC